MKRAVFLDRDGTLIEEKHYLSDPDEVVLIPGAGEALKDLQQAGFLLFVVSNQSGVGRGLFTLDDVEAVNRRLVELLDGFGVRFERIYVAPEAPGEPSRGRKPSPQFLLDARREFDIDLAESFIVGDKLVDLECGWNAEVRAALLVRTGHGPEHEPEIPPDAPPHIVVDSIREAADAIMGWASRRGPRHPR